ncbi:ATP-dependent RNA helicase glh-2-like [Cydia fagiglandana]|uniref:ATP-dependent RNA helicase glh-2-like n=1 Tax=Cydia fagiglandana TaxID=1458189 RepID=UPI002FEE0EFE
MKLFILAALIAVSSAARLEHLEQQRGLKEYLPPVQSGQGQFGQQSFGQSFGGHGSNDFASQGSNSLDAGDSAGFGSAPQGLRASAGGARGFSSFNAARSNQYLPPDHGPSGSHGSHGQDAFGASSNQFGSQSQFGQNTKFGAQGSSGFGSQGSNGFGSHGSQGAHGAHGSGFGAQGSSFGSQGFGSQGSQGSHGFGSQGSQGSHGFGSQSSQGSQGFGSQGSQGFVSQGSQGFGSQGSQGSHGFGSQGSQGFGSQGSKGFGSQGSSFGSQGARQQNLRQYLAPKTSHDNIPQQPFDPESGYIY